MIPANMNAALLNINNLVCGRAGQPVSAPFTANLTAGAGLCLLGPNGCGKTTILRTLANLLDPLSGTFDISPHHFIPAQGDALNALTVAEYLHLKKTLFENTSQKQTPDPFNLKALEHKKIAALSQGQKQKLNLHTLLLQDRPVWLLDEPTNALDKNAQDTLAYLVKTKRASGGMIVIATHDSAHWPDFEMKMVSPA